MEKTSRLILANTVLMIICGCHQQQTIPIAEGANGLADPTKMTHDPQRATTVVVDTVKTEKDPKAGWFGPNIRNAYFEHSDKPVIFCGSGPSIPTGKLITIFTNMKESTPESVECNDILAITEGQGHWYKGRAFTDKELEVYLENEENIITDPMELPTNHMLRAWMKAKPNGEPCSDTVTYTSDPLSRKSYPAYRNKDKNCSIIIEHDGILTFINWKVVGQDAKNGIRSSDPLRSVLANDVVNNIVANYGSKYLIPETHNK